MLNNMKIGRRISLVISVLLALGLTALIFISYSKLNSGIKQTAEDRFLELADARATVVEDYFNGLKRYFWGMAIQDVVKEALANPDDPEKVAACQSALETYITTNSNMEGMFIMDTKSNIICHTVKSAIGGVVYKDQATIDSVLSAVDAAENHVMSRGVAVSTSTGKQVASVFVGIYDSNGKMLGCLGGGCFISELQNIIGGMELNGLSASQAYLVNNTRNTYIFAPDEELQGQEVDNSIHLAAMAKGATSQEGVYTETVEGGTKLIIAYNVIPSLNFEMIVIDARDEVMATATSVGKVILSFGIAILIAMVVITIFVASRIGKDVSNVGDIITEVGTLDLTKAEKLRAYANRKDEVGMIAKAAGELAYAVRNSVQALRERSETLADDSEQLAASAEKTMDSLSQIDKAVREIAEGATNQSSETQNASDSVVKIGNMVEETINQTDKLKEAAESMQTSSERAKGILKDLSEINDKTKESVNVIYEQTNETNASAEKIQEATALISSIADQTNLLSLNASIEAARAGEMGKGFAVVAQEIGQLAEQSSSSAKQIEDVIAALVENSKRAVSTMDEVKEIMEKQNEYIEKTGEIFGDVDVEINSSLNGINEISDTVSRLNDLRNVVVDAVSSLTAIAEENAASTEETSASATIVNDMMGDVSSIAARVSDTAKNIKDDVDVFTI